MTGCADRGGALALLAGVLLWPWGQGSVARGEVGPLPVTNLAPHHVVFLEPPPESPVTIAGRQVALDLAYGTVYIDAPSESTRATIDCEVARVALRFEQGVGRRTQVGVWVPFVWMGPGVFDDLLVRYHRALGLDDGGRDEGPGNDFHYAVTKGRHTYRPGPEGRVGLGDLILRLKRDLGGGPNPAVRVAARLLAKLPTGDPSRGYGSGAADGALGLLAKWTGSPLGVFGAADLVYLGGSPDPALPLATHWAVKAAAGLSYPLWRLGHLSAQLDYFSTPYATGSAPLDRDVLMLAAGFQRDLAGGGRWAVGFTEDLSARASPDFSLFASVEWWL